MAHHVSHRSWLALGALVLAVVVLVLTGERLWMSVASAVHAADEWLITLLLGAEGPLPSLEIREAIRDVTALGSFSVTGLVLLVTAAFILATGEWREALGLVAVVASGVVVVMLLKAGVDRPRPELVPFGPHVATASFPSGHAAKASLVATSVVLTLWYRLRHRPARAVLVVVAVTTTLAVGASRVYLGVHWPSDVLGGWLIGAGWALLGWWLLWRAGPGGTAEPEDPQAERGHA